MKDDDAHHDEANHDDDRPHEAVLRFSLAGVQLKFSAVMEASGGLTIPAGGMGGSWIVKLPSARFAAVPENEFAMLGSRAPCGHRRAGQLPRRSGEYQGTA